MNAIANFDLTARQLALVKHTVAKDCNPDEFNLFVEAARSYGLDPFRKQIMPLVFGKNSRDPAKRRMSIVVSRDGLRVIAARCKNYRPASDKAEWEIDPALISPLNPKGLVSCTVYLWQQDSNGQWFRVKGEAEWDEFAPITEEWAEGEDGKRRPTGRKALDTSGNWAKMPKVMLEKCAEAQALRAGWPEQFGGVYAEEELDKARIVDLTATEIVEAEAAEQRMKRIGGERAIMFLFDVNVGMERIPVGQVADRFLAESRKAKDLNELATLRARNADSLREFWAYDANDALALKQEVEKFEERLRAEEPAAA
jgi:phage recombination protein Bet